MDPRSFVKAEESTLLGTFEVSNKYMINFYCGYNQISWCRMYITYHHLWYHQVTKRRHVYVRISPLNPTELFTSIVYLVNSLDLYLLFENEPNVRCTEYMYVCQHAIILIPTKSISHVVNHQHSKYQTNSFQFNLTLMR